MNSDKKWLIKSENKILGPYNFEQIEDLLLKKQISLIDEVRDTGTRWLYLRENQEFKKTVDAVREKLDSKSDSTKAIHTSISQSGTASLDEFQQTDVSLPKFTDVALMPIQDVSVVSETPTEEKNEDNVVKTDIEVKPKIAKKIKTYAFQDDFKTKQHVQVFSKKFLVIVLVCIAFAAASISGYAYYLKYSQLKSELDLIASIKRYKLIGLDQKAIEAYSKLPIVLQQKYRTDVIEYFPMLESTGLIQFNDIEEIESLPELSLENKLNIVLAKFWFYMQTQNYELAENQIVKAKAIQPSNALVVENEAILDLRKDQFKKAIDSFIKLYSQNSSGRYIVGALQALQGLNQSDKEKYYSEVEKLVDRHVATRFDYTKELLLAQMAFAKNKNNEILFKLSWQQFINTPVQLKNNFRKPTLLASGSYLWKDLESYKSVVRQGLSLSDDILFQVHNYLELSEISAAVDFADKNLNVITDQAIKQQVNLLLYFALNKKNEILSLDKTNQLDQKSVLNHFILAITKIEINPNSNIDSHIDFFKQKNLKFYDHWVRLAKLVKAKSNNEIKTFLKENYFSDDNFNLVYEARGLID